MTRFSAFIRYSALAAVVILPAATHAQQNDPKQQQQQVHGSQGAQSVPASGTPDQDQGKTTVAAGATDVTPAPQEDSLAAAARKAREQKKESSKPAKVFTNDNIATSGGVSSVGESSAAPAGSPADAAAGANPSGKDEKAWRDKFASLHHKLDSDKENLDVMQRELGLLDVQYYNDPVKAMQQQYSREDINKKTADIEAKKKDIEADQQAIDDAEDDLRKAGGDPGWAR